MYTIIKNVIENTEFDLASITEKINANWVQDYITDEERLELLALAQERANPDNTGAKIQEQVNALADRVAAIEEAIAGGTTITANVKYNIMGLSAAEIDTTKIPGYVKADTKDQYYVFGDTMQFRGTYYVMTREGKTINLDPITYPIGWTKLDDYIASLTSA